MTFHEIDPTVRASVEQLGFEAGCLWIEDFRDERGRDPEPEECAEEATSAAERLTPRISQLLQTGGVALGPDMLAQARRVLCEQFVEALEL